MKKIKTKKISYNATKDCKQLDEWIDEDEKDKKQKDKTDKT